MNCKFTCPHFEAQRCRSCTLLNLSYETQLECKNKRVKELFSDTPWVNLIKKVVPVTKASGSRNKAKLIVSGYAHEPVVGLLTDDYKGVPLTDCPWHAPAINEVAQAAPAIIKMCGIPPYDIKKQPAPSVPSSALQAAQVFHHFESGG